MTLIYGSLRRLWLFIPVKLGRCPFCIRAAARGTLVAWVAFGTLSLIGAHALLYSLTLLIALAFTALLLAHMTAFTWRAVPHIVRSLGWPPVPQPNGERREFFGSVIKVSTAAIALSLMGFGRIVLARAETDRCKTQRLNQPLSSSGSDEDEVKRDLELQARGICDDLCLDKWCETSKDCKLLSMPSFKSRAGLELGACGSSGSQSGGQTGGVSCFAFLHACYCDCIGDFISPRCTGPNVFDLTGEPGSSEEAARDNLLEQAAADCSAVCSKKDSDCEAQNRFCVSRGRGYQVRIRRCDPVEGGGFTCTGQVICPCECAKEF